MEYINGQAFGDIMWADLDSIHHYLNLAVDAQISVHKVSAAGFPCQSEKLKSKIAAAPIWIAVSDRH